MIRITTVTACEQTATSVPNLLLFHRRDWNGEGKSRNIYLAITVQTPLLRYVLSVLCFTMDMVSAFLKLSVCIPHF